LRRNDMSKFFSALARSPVQLSEATMDGMRTRVKRWLIRRLILVAIVMVTVCYCVYEVLQNFVAQTVWAVTISVTCCVVGLLAFPPLVICIEIVAEHALACVVEIIAQWTRQVQRQEDEEQLLSVNEMTGASERREKARLCLKHTVDDGNKLYSLVQAYNRAFGPFIFTTTILTLFMVAITAFIASSVALSGAMGFGSATHSQRIMLTLYYASMCLLAASRLFTLAQLGQALTDATSTAAAVLEDVIAEEHSPLNANVTIRRAEVLRRRLQRHGSVTPARCFVMGRSAFLTAVAGAVTQVIILLQFKLGEK